MKIFGQKYSVIVQMLIVIMQKKQTNEGNNW